MVNSLWFFLPGILALGIITSYTDIKSGKIKNKIVFGAIIYAILANILISFVMPVTKEYMVHSFWNPASALIIGFIMWHMRLWTAGDGKLFVAFSALIPLSIYSLGYQKYIPSFTLLINIFIPALLIMVVFMIFKIKKSNLIKMLKTILKEFFLPKKLQIGRASCRERV